MKKFLFSFCILAAALTLPFKTQAYPQSVKATVSLSISQATGGIAITNTNRYLIVGYAKNLKLIDLGTLALAADQPPDLSDSTTTDYNVGGIAYVSNGHYIYASQDSGKLLRYSLDVITNSPTVTTIAESEALLNIAAVEDGATLKLYILNNSERVIYAYHISPSSAVETIDLKTVLPNSAFSVNDMLYVPETGELYIATNIGQIIYMDSNGQLNDPIPIDVVNSDNIVDLAANDDGSKVYAVNKQDTSVEVISTSTHTRGTPIALTPGNSNLVSIAIADVVNPGAVYGFVSGQNGVSVFNTSSDSAIDQDTSNTAGTIDPIDTSYYGSLVASTDGYIYMSSNRAGDLSIITDRPYVSVSSVVYKDASGATAEALEEGGTVEITFQSDVTGTYVVRANGSIDQSGGLLTDTSGNTSGSVTAATDKTVIFAYDTNASLLNEGDNIFFFFVTDSGLLTGRLGSTVTVDLPPGAITMEATDFGNGRIYVTFARLTAADMDHYNIYVDTDPVAVRTKTEIAATVSQPSSGNSVTATITGLTNDTVYYVAVEGVDSNSNVGPRAYLYPDGTQVSAAPQETMSLARLSGETGGCSLQIAHSPLPRWEGVREGVRGRVTKAGTQCIAFLLATLIPLFAARRRHLFLILILLFAAPQVANAAAKGATKWWSTEFKLGFWMPTNSTTKTFFNNCCNIQFGVNGGLLYKGRYGAEMGVGIMDKNSSAVGGTNGAVSGDTFNLFLLPMETNAVWRFDYLKDQIVVPYIKGGVDYVFYRENFMGDVTKGLKTGLHANGGLQFLLKHFDEDRGMEEYGISDFYVVIDARYGWVNSFGKTGLDLSGATYSAGLLFEF